jgi:AraC-like DNA-binding protein
MATEWLLRARRYEYHLSAVTPFHAEAHLHPDPTPLELDIHNGIELGILLQGAEERHYQGHVLHCRPGDVWMCAMWEPHGWRVTRPNTRNLMFVFLPQFLGEELSGDIPWLTLLALPPHKRPTVSTPEMRRHITAITQELLHEVQARSRGWATSVRLNLLRLLLTLSRDWMPLRPAPDVPVVDPHYLSRIMPALTLVHTDPGLRIPAAQAAAACRLSRAQFNRIFSHAMGLSFSRFSLRARLALTAHLLLATDLPTQSIAHQAGFTDASHLHRTFLQHYGCTPGRYRERGGHALPH